jgi:hypothetical protein
VFLGLQQATDAFELTSQRLRYRLRATLPAVNKGFTDHSILSKVAKMQSHLRLHLGIVRRSLMVKL